MVSTMRKYLILLVLLLLPIISSCGLFKVKLSNFDAYYFDTYINIRVWDIKKYKNNAKLWKETDKILRRIQITFQRNKDDDFEPELYRLNQSAGSGKPFKVSDELFEVIKLSLEFAELTDGKFDPTIGPLVDLWDITGKPYDDEQGALVGTPPTQAEIDKVLPLIDYRLVKLDEENKTVSLPLKGMVIDLGAIAKGFAADVLAKFYREKGIKHAIIDLGGNIYALGERYEQRSDGSIEWSIGIRKPEPNSSVSVATLYVIDKTVVTSGPYERYFIDSIDENKRYHHILDPDTGYPFENDIASVTVVCDSSALADALSTSLFALGIQDGIKFVEENFPDVAVVFIDYGLNFYTTNNADELYKFTPSI